MKNIVLIIGARPNFMKAFPLYESLKKYFDLTLIHTGQHFDEKMSKVFFEQLKFPHPDIHLTLDKRTKAGDFNDKLYVNNKEYLKNKDQVIEDLLKYQGELGQLGEIRDKLKKEFEKLNPDLVMVFGDVTSTLAAGLAAKMLNIDIAHVESGLRSGDIQMPEEVNRILTDHITTYYFVTEQSGVDNLKTNDITENVYLVGNTMIDTQKKYLQQALNTKYHEILGIKSKEYILITLHRPSNVDDMVKLQEIFNDLEELSKTETLVYPIHPRTKKNLDKLGYLKKVIENPNIILEEPLGYLEFTCLIAHCKYVVTDSGGLQEETTALDIPCFTLRENTERPCTLVDNHGTNQMIQKISEIDWKASYKSSMDLWDGKSSINICNILRRCNYTSSGKNEKYVFVCDHFGMGGCLATLLSAYDYAIKHDRKILLLWNSCLYNQYNKFSNKYINFFKNPNIIDIQNVNFQNKTFFPEYNIFSSKPKFNVSYLFKDNLYYVKPKDIFNYMITYGYPSPQYEQPYKFWGNPVFTPPEQNRNEDIIIINRNNKKYLQYYNVITLQDKIQSKINYYYKKYELWKNIGVHVRFPNNEKTTRGRERCQIVQNRYKSFDDMINFYFRNIDKILKKEPNCKILFVSDNISIFENFKRKYKNKMINFCTTDIVSEVDPYRQISTYDTGEKCLVDCFILSYCKYLICSNSFYTRPSLMLKQNKNTTYVYQKS